MDKTEKTINKNLIYKGHILSLYVDEIETPFKTKATREYIHHAEGAACLAIKDGLIYLERQYRYPYSKELLEVPAGKLDEGEDKFEGMKRELQEEIGFISKDLRYLGYIYPSCGCMDEILHLFYSPINEIGDTNPDEDELIEIVKVTPAEAYKMLDEGLIHDAKTVVLLEKLRKELLK